MPNSTTVKSVLWSLAALAVIYRVGAGELIEGRSKFLGIF